MAEGEGKVRVVRPMIQETSSWREMEEVGRERAKGREDERKGGKEESRRALTEIEEDTRSLQPKKIFKERG